MTTADTLLFYSQQDDPVEWRAALQSHLPDLPVHIFPDVGDPLDIAYALVWKPPAGFFVPFRRLRLVINLGAGVDSLLGRTDLPDVPITRLFDPNMARMMSSFVQMAVLRHARDIPKLERAQREGRWHYIHPRDPANTRVGVMGLGELGGRAAAELARHGFQVHGWSRTLKQIKGVMCTAGEAALDTFLGQSDILVCMLPLTPATTGLLNAERFAALPRGAAFVNVARGPVVDEAALLAALQSGYLAEATLDVFATEPLPPGHAFWDMDNVLITPHLASIALPASAAGEIAANIRRLRAGESVTHTVDPARGY
jgi:glyoxylate/hydroxypyruvate reductase A